MEIFESTFAEYKTVFTSNYHVFNTAEFNNLNQDKCTEVKYLIFKDSKFRLGLIAGVRNGYLLSPFSSPFGGFSFMKQDVQIDAIEKAVSLLEDYAKQNDFKGIKIALPPLFYSESFLSKVINVLYRCDFTLFNLDLDFYLPLFKVSNYADNIWYNAKKNLKISQKQEFLFSKCTIDDLEEVYDVIKKNREAKGKPLNMSLASVLATTDIIDTDLFVVRKDNVAVASAIVFNCTDTILYVPFWGDIPGYGTQKPMNYLTYKIFEYYFNLGKKIVHIGISTEESQPNYGLCEFKESLGCEITPKLTFTKEFHVL